MIGKRFFARGYFFFYSSLARFTLSSSCFLVVPSASAQRPSIQLAFQSGRETSISSPRRSCFVSAPKYIPFQGDSLPNWAKKRQHLSYHHRFFVDASTTSTSLFLARGRSSSTAKDGKNRSSPSTKTPVGMPRGVKKENLPSKICVTCGRPFTWRKKWERCWDEVTTCSKSCNHKRRVAKRSDGDKSSSNEYDEADIYGDDDDDDGISQEQEFSRRGSKPAKKQDKNRINAEMEGLALDSGSTMFYSSALDDQYSDNGDQPDGILNDVFDVEDAVSQKKADRKAAKKALKSERRAQREGKGDPTAGQKTCDMCSKSVDLLIRCMYKEGQTSWSMVCGKCWKVASGGVVDGDEDHPHYRYGGLWKNRRAALQKS